MLAGLPDAVGLTDSEGRVVFLNAAAERLFGIPDADARERDTIALFVAPRDHEQARELLGRLQAGERVPAGVHLRLQRTDGSGFDGEIAAAPMFGEDEAVTGV